MIKKKTLNILQNKYLPFVFLTVLMFILHMAVQYSYDDIFFQTALEDGYLSFIKTRYSFWSSRLFIESILCLVVRSPVIVFRFLNIIFVLLLTASITKLISSDMETRISWTVVLLFLIYPFTEMSSAGWAATSLNYLWPAAAGTFALIPFVKGIRNEKIQGFEYPFYILALIFAANQEQTAALLFGFGIVFTVYLFTRDKGVSKFLIFYNVIALGCIIFIILCPGNSIRLAEETETWYPQHAYFSVHFKLLLGISNTLNYLFNFNKANTFIVLLAFSLLVIIIKKNIGKIPTMLAFVTFILCLLTKVSHRRPLAAFKTFISYLDLQQNPYNGMSSFIPILVYSIVLGCIFLEIYFVYGKNIKSWLLWIILCAGLAASCIIGFSPTIYASGYRICLFLDLTLIVVISFIAKFQWKSFPYFHKQVFYAILFMCASNNYLDTINSLFH